MEEKPGARPLMLGPWPGSGGRAGDKGKLLYTNTPVMERRWENTHTFTQNKEEEEKDRGGICGHPSVQEVIWLLTLLL